MKVKFKNDKELTQVTWLNENNRGQMITIHKGDIFKTGAWGHGGYESVITDKGEWICDVDCKEFNELFEVVIEDIIGQERYWKSDTNHERFRVIEFEKERKGLKYYTIEYFTTNNRKQCQDEKTILEKSILLELELELVSE